MRLQGYVSFRRHLSDDNLRVVIERACPSSRKQVDSPLVRPQLNLPPLDNLLGHVVVADQQSSIVEGSAERGDDEWGVGLREVEEDERGSAVEVAPVDKQLLRSCRRHVVEVSIHLQRDRKKVLTVELAKIGAGGGYKEGRKDERGETHQDVVLLSDLEHALVEAQYRFGIL